MDSLGVIASSPKFALKYLVHPLHGIFIWSPVTIFSFLGLIFWPKGKQKLGYFFITTWLCFLLLYGFIPEWYAGWSFSNRYLIGLFPLYIIGLSAFLEMNVKKMRWIIVLTTTYSIVLFINWHLCVMNPEFDTPAALVKIWSSGKSSTFIGGTINAEIVLKRLWEWCRYKYIFRIF
ncbi:hypothetical protein ACFL2Y_02525 [Candidatus Omnitrophota bacterium]